MAACFSSGEHILVSVRRVRREGSKTGLRLLFWLCRARGETSLSVERLYVDLQLSRSTCHCLHTFSFSYLFLTALRDFLDMTKRPLSVSPSNKWVEIFCLSPLALLCLVHGSFIHRCLYFSSTNFSIFFRAAIEAAEQPSNKSRNSSFLVNRWKLSPSFRCLSYLLQPKAQQKTVFSVAVQLGWSGWPCHARLCACPLDRRAVQKQALWNCQNNKLAGRQTRRVDVLYQNLLHARNSESHFISPCLPQSRFLCDRRPTSVSRKSEICATRATNKVHIDEQPVGESKKAKFNLFLGQLPRQIGSSKFYQTRVIR